jgi:hypothetical protein
MADPPVDQLKNFVPQYTSFARIDSNHITHKYAPHIAMVFQKHRLRMIFSLTKDDLQVDKYDMRHKTRQTRQTDDPRGYETLRVRGLSISPVLPGPPRGGCDGQIERVKAALELTGGVKVAAVRQLNVGRTTTPPQLAAFIAEDRRLGARQADPANQGR